MTGLHTSLQGNSQLTYGRSHGEAQAAGVARKLYQQACSRSWLDKVRSVLSGSSHHLFDLAKVQASCKILGQRDLGPRTVSISQIRGSGSEGRCRDFDADFRPLKTHNESRWLGVAAARQRGVKAPPVSLTQVGDIYFVEDGHHRISVARALGQEKIEAVVTVWQVAGPLPWQELTTPPRLQRQPSLIPEHTKV
jgi:hypothetical protein